MPTIEISEQQKARFEELRAELAEAFVDGYGTVRDRDALEYLLDRHEEAGGVAADASGDAPTATVGEDGESGDDSGTADADDGDGGGDGGGEDDGDDRLAAMMNLLEDHADKWRETDDEEGNYEVDLPEGGVEVVRTKDDVRAVLFSNY